MSDTLPYVTRFRHELQGRKQTMMRRDLLMSVESIEKRTTRIPVNKLPKTELLNLWGALESFHTKETEEGIRKLEVAIAAVNTELDRIDALDMQHRIDELKPRETRCDKQRDKNRLKRLVTEVLDCLSLSEIVDTCENVKASPKRPEHPK